MSALPRPLNGNERATRGIYHTGIQQLLAPSFGTAINLGTCANVPYDTTDDPSQVKRHIENGLLLINHVKYVTPLHLIEQLGVLDLYIKFDDAAKGSGSLADNSDDTGIFAELASAAPRRSGEHLIYPAKTANRMVEACISDSSGKSICSSKTALAAHFKWLFERMRNADKSKWPGIQQQSSLVYDDLQCKPIPGSNTKPDGLFFLRHCGSTALQAAQMVLVAKPVSLDDGLLPANIVGELGDYVLHMWTEQFTRIYVPILLLHGEKLSLVVFMRSGVVLVACLGPVISSNSRTELVIIKRTLRCLWFFATLGSSKFGHVCDIPSEYLGIRFATPNNDGFTNISLALSTTGKRIAGMREWIQGPVRLFGRVSYLYRVTFESKDAVLKFTWMSVHQLPEGAVYQLLNERCKAFIPEVYASGIVEKDWLGYQLVFQITEYSGIPIDLCIREYKHGGRTQSYMEETICNTLKESSNCVAKAYLAGILHRDISYRNILIKDGKTKIVSWGLSRLHRDIGIKHIKSAERTWRFDLETVLREEPKYDALADMNFSMSIQVLLGTLSRNLTHDLESIFYIALYALTLVEATVDSYKYTPIGFHFVGNHPTAAARVGCLSSANSYRQCFGVSKCLPATAMVLNSMHRFLFFKNGVFIAGAFLTDPNKWHLPDIDEASGFMNAKLLQPERIGDFQAPLGREIAEMRITSVNVDNSTNNGIKKVGIV
ncbi:hypothetical protein IW140_002316 [Coemansia sp. RSA 1813]|nr:hypothetical protein IW140_002316 [Coemansia sp. RSA 1813]